MNYFAKSTTSFIVLCLTLACIFSGNASGITIEEEEKLSKEFLKITFKHYDIIEDPMITGYVNNIGQKIVAELPSPPFQYRFYVIREDVYNAFAGPAGHIFINSGLLEGLHSENELAGILAHEVSHVACRHISKMVDRSKKTTLVTLAGIAAGIFLGVGGAPAAASAVTVGSIAAGASMSLAYSRKNEMEADQIALKYLRNAGYTDEGLLKALKKIRSRNWYGSDQIPTYLTTHPATEDRIAYISSSSEENAGEPFKTEATQFAIIQTRLTALYGGEKIARKKFETAVRNKPDQYLSHYGYGLVLTRVGDNNGAAKHFKKALEIKPLDQAAVRELGRVYFLNGNYKEAHAMLIGAASPSSRDSEVRYYLGRTLKELGKHKEAALELEQLLKEDPNYTQAYYHLGLIYGEQEIMGKAHYYLGLYYAKKGHLKNAVFHLRRAVSHLKEPKKKNKAEEILKSVGRNADPDADQQDTPGLFFHIK
jgi:predicted Zn-dependent protease